MRRYDSNLRNAVLRTSQPGREVSHEGQAYRAYRHRGEKHGKDAGGDGENAGAFPGIRGTPAPVSYTTRHVPHRADLSRAPGGRQPGERDGRMDRNAWRGALPYLPGSR